jgi:Protein of unknown function (DUF1549)/Protein of unknown function (DUF1553)
MPQLVCRVFTLSLILVACGTCTGAELFDANATVAQAIDHYIDIQNSERGRSVAPVTNDDVILRRTTLDLAGRIPTVAERNWFLEQPVAERRSRLIERLMAIPGSNYHLRDSLDELLLANKPHTKDFRDYLLWAVEQRRPWDQMFRDMLLADATDKPQSGAAEFVRSRVRELDDLTNDTAILFFGVNVSCAKCHDHPLVDDWKQDHYFGMQAFFNRTFLSKKNVVLEKPFGNVSFKTLDGEDKTAPLMFLNGTRVPDETPDFPDDQRKELQEQIRKLEDDDDADVDWHVEFSPRGHLIDVALADQTDRFFARSIANLTWLRLMGCGLVDPPDQMHSGNPPSHPELLQWLARDLTDHQYDLWRLIQGITSSNAYARDTIWPSQDEPPDPQAFAVATPRPLTPRQLAMSLQVAVCSPERWPAIDDDVASSKSLDDLRQRSDAWSREFQQPGESFQVAVDESLFFSNSDRVQNELLNSSNGGLVGHLSQIDDDATLINALWQNVLSRDPTDAELLAATEWLQREGTERQSAIRDLVWATLAGPEMRFNH